MQKAICHNSLPNLLAVLMTILLAGGFVLPAVSQTPWPHITAVTQSSGQRGTTIELKITGVYVGQGTGLMLEGGGLTAEAITPEPVPSGKPPKPEGTLTARVRIASDAEPGWRALRVLTPNGPSDLGHFAIGMWPEVIEKEPNNTRSEAQEVPLPVTIIGHLDPGEDVDCFRFAAEAGRTLICDIFAARMNSPVAPVLAIQDAEGKEVALNSDFRAKDVPLVFPVPKTGTYYLFLHDLNYQGGSDHTYRLTLGAIPYVTGVLPPGGPPGASLNLQLTGFNLGSASTCHVTLPSDPRSEPFTQSLPLPVGSSNPVLLMTGTVPEQMATEQNDSMTTAQLLPVPATVNGRLYRLNSSQSAVSDYYRFHATQGQRLILEVFAQRLGSPLDSVLTILNAKGKELASNDDAVGTDSRLEFTAPQTGDYIAQITDLNQRQGPDYVYRFTLHVPEPDFHLTFAPDRLSIGQGGAIPLTVTATRLNGFNGDIALEWAGLPTGLHIVGSPQIRSGQNEDYLVAVADTSAAIQTGKFQITGVATINGKSVRHAAQSLLEEYVRDNNQQIQRTTRPSVLPVAAIAPPPDMTVTAVPDHPVLALGKTVEIKVKITRKAGFTAKVPLMLLGLPDGISATTPDIAEKQTEATITLKAESNAHPGESTLLVIGKSVLDELRFTPCCAPPITLTVKAP